MSEFIFPTVKPHLLTSNVYVQKKIVIENIKNLDKSLNTKISQDLKNAIFFKIVNLKKIQLSFLKNLNEKIRITEQNSFPFGGLSSL